MRAAPLASVAVFAEEVVMSDACLRCGSDMVERRRRSDGHPFLGCTSYPDCSGTREIDPGDTPNEDPWDDCFSVVHDGD